MKLRLGRDEVEAIAFVVDPIIGRLDVAAFEPGKVGGAHVEGDLRKQTAAAAGEDGHAHDLIFLDPARCHEAVERSAEDGVGNRFERERLDLALVDRAEQRWVGGGVGRQGLQRRGVRRFGGRLAGQGSRRGRWEGGCRRDGLRRFRTASKKNGENDEDAFEVFHGCPQVGRSLRI